MARKRLSEQQKDRGLALGAVIKTSRQDRSAEAVAVAAGIGIDTLRKIERGAISNPGFFVVAALAAELGTSLDDLASQAMGNSKEGSANAKY